MGEIKDAYNRLMGTWGYPHENAAPPPAPKPDTDPTQLEWEMIYRKFRQIYGRDPYSFLELRDWWDRF